MTTIVPLIMGIILFEGCAQYCVKRGNVERNLYYCLLAVLFYTCVITLLYYVYDYGAMGVVNALWSGFSILSIIMIGVLIYHETINYWDYIGIIFIIIGIFFIFIKGHNH
jgi:multidrug transporter EmrE-like cation transporter